MLSLVSDCQAMHTLHEILIISFTAWMETQRQTNGIAITVGGQKPMLDNSIDRVDCCQCFSQGCYLSVSVVNIIGVLSDPVPIYTAVQHWLLATNHDRIATGLSLSLHPCSKTDYEYFMLTCAPLDVLTPTVTRPLHHTVSVTLINPDSEQCGEGRH